MATRAGDAGARDDGRILVLGIGNVLTGDDAFGPTVVKLLEAEFDLPPRVEALDAGTPGMDLVALAAGAARVIVVDTVLSDGPAGTVKTWTRDQLLAKRLTPRVNPHAPGLIESLFTLDLSGDGPVDVLLVGVVPGRTDVGIGMSEAVEAAVPAVLDVIAGTLDGWGLTIARRSEPGDPDLWWRVADRGAFLCGSASPSRALERDD